MIRYGWLWCIAFVLCGCDAPDTGMGGKAETLSAPSAPVAALNRFEGKWFFYLEGTLAAWKDAGMPYDEVQQTRRTYTVIGPLHPNISFDGNLAIGDLPPSEYRLFSIHQHDQTVCAKVWHHKHRQDPGAMSKGYVQLAMVDEALHMKVRFQEQHSLTDPDFLGTTPIEAPGGAACDADAPAVGTWSDWTTYVFLRREPPWSH